MDQPCVKGSIFQSVANDVKGMVDSGVIGEADLQSLLDEKDRAALDSMVTAISWIPIATYGRLLDVLARFEGGPDREAYLRKRGAEAAERLLAGTYAGFDAAAGTWGARVAQSMIGIASLLYNFTRWSFDEPETGIYVIRAEEAADYPETARHTAHGFLQAFANKSSTENLRVTSQRVRPDVVHFRIEPVTAG